MRGRTLLATTLVAVAVALAAAGCGGTPTVEWSPPVNSVPFSCAYDPDKLSQMDAEIDKHRDIQRGGNLSDKWLKEEEKVKQLQILARQTANLSNGATFNVANGLENVFDYYRGVNGPDEERKVKFICDKVDVFNDEGYVVVFGRDGHPPTARPGIAKDLPYSIAYVFKSRPSGMELAGFVPNYGHHRFAQVVKDYPGLGDLLILSSLVNYSLGRHEEIYEENNTTLDAAAQEFDFKNFLASGGRLTYVSKLTIYKVGQGELERIVSRPLYFGRKVEPEDLKLVHKEGKPELQVSVSVELDTGSRYLTKSGTFDLDQLVAEGIRPTVPLFRR